VTDEPVPIRYRVNGSIDTAFYTSRARQERARAMARPVVQLARMLRKWWKMARLDAVTSNQIIEDLIAWDRLLNARNSTNDGGGPCPRP
jgi:hypothetical protein